MLGRSSQSPNLNPNENLWKYVTAVQINLALAYIFLQENWINCLESSELFPLVLS